MSGRQPNGALGTRTKVSCGYFSLRRASTFLWLISSVALCPRSTSAPARAMPGERWPPVPPQAMIKLFTASPPRTARDKCQVTSDKKPEKPDSASSCHWSLGTCHFSESPDYLRQRALADERLRPLPIALAVDDDADE